MNGMNDVNKEDRCDICGKVIQRVMKQSLDWVVCDGCQELVNGLEWVAGED